jgi:hypothetical protein
MSASGLLVTQIEKCESFNFDNHWLSTNSKTFSLGDGVPERLRRSSIGARLPFVEIALRNEIKENLAQRKAAPLRLFLANAPGLAGP